MAKDSYWFKHDSTAGRGTRMRKMAFIYGHWGKGIYWDVIEILRDQSHYKFEKDDESLRLLADLIGCKDEGKFMNWFKDCVRLELLQTTDKHFFSQVLLDNMGVWESKKNNGGKKKKKRNESEIVSESKANRKHKIIEDNIIEYNNTIDSLFIEFTSNQSAWEVYCKNKNLKSVVNGNRLLKEFLTDNMDKLDRPVSDIKDHFKNWINKLPAERKEMPKQVLSENAKLLNSFNINI